MSKILERANQCGEFEDKFLKGHVNYGVEWGYLYEIFCQIYKKKDACIKSCKHRNICKLYVMKTNEGVVPVKRTCKKCKAAN